MSHISVCVFYYNLNNASQKAFSFFNVEILHGRLEYQDIRRLLDLSIVHEKYKLRYLFSDVYILAGK